MKLFLDDRLNPKDVFLRILDFDYHNNDEWVVVKTYNEFVSFIKHNELPKLISFDHDLVFEHYLIENQLSIDYDNMEVKTGYHAAKWLIDYCEENRLKLPSVKFHTMNIEGRKNMEKLFV